MLNIPIINYLTDVYFDFGAARAIPELLETYGMQRPLLITDKGLVSIGIVERLGINAIAIFDNVGANPTQEMAMNALMIYKENGCGSIVAVGGGSPIDLAKCVALLVNHPLPLEQYAFVRGGVKTITDNMPPLLAIPTTAGSGSEVGRAALITTPELGKVGFLSKHLLPRASVCDPELTLALPPKLTAGTGMDAISHCIETFCSPRYNPIAEAIALDGLERGFANIAIATHEGTDREARKAMMMCSLQGGLAFQKGLGVIHSLSHPLGSLTEKALHHGTLNALFTPYALKYNYDHCIAKMETIASRLRLPNATQLPELFARLNENLSLPSRLRELGLTKEELEPLAAMAAADHCSATNPRPLSVHDCLQLYLEAW